MRRSVYSDGIGDPLKAFGNDLLVFQGRGYFLDLESDLTALLSGKHVASEDGKLELSARKAIRGFWKLIVRRPGAQFTAEMLVRALEPYDDAPYREAEDLDNPIPRRWRVQQNGVWFWRLFNCVIISLDSLEEDVEDEDDALLKEP